MLKPGGLLEIRKLTVSLPFYSFSRQEMPSTERGDPLFVARPET